MPRKGARRRIAKGVYEDRTGISAIYRDHAGKQREVRFPAGTTIKDIRAAVKDRQDQEPRNTRAVVGTLARAVEEWEPLERHLASFCQRRSDLRAWITLLGNRPLAAITRQMVMAALSQWAAAGLKPGTIRNRLWILGHLYQLRHGSKGYNPCEDVRPPPQTRTMPGWVSPDVILAVYGRLLDHEKAGWLRDAKQRARFMVLASTGRRPSEVMRAKPEDIDLVRNVWRVRDGKGGWTPGGLPLNADRLEAWRVFAEADAWGPYNTGTFGRLLRRCGWPASVRPYNLRHSVGIDMSEAGVDLQDVGAALGHANVQTTRSAYVPILSSRMQRAAAALDGRLNGWKVAEQSGETLERKTGTDGK